MVRLNSENPKLDLFMLLPCLTLYLYRVYSLPKNQCHTHWVLMKHSPAANVDGLAGDAFRFFRCQEYGHGGNFLNLKQTVL